MTAQICDILIYNDEQLCITTKPLSVYLNKIELPHKLVAPNTACWKGYYAKWAIDNKKLFLIEWHGYILDYLDVGMDYIFPGKDIVFAEWFCGDITIPVGNLVDYVHGGFASVYEGKMCLTINKGVLINEKVTWLSPDQIKIIQKEYDNLPF